MVSLMSTPRFDLFSNIHKAIRLATSDLLIRMGATDFSDAQAAERIATDLALVLALCEDHRRTEDEIVLPTLRTRMSGDLVSVLDAHEDQQQMVAELAAAARTLVAESPENRPRVGRTLYLHFSKLVGELLTHMVEEEQVASPLFARLFTPEEMLAIHGKVMALLSVEEHARGARYLLRAINRQERLAVMNGAFATFPKEAIVALVDAGFAS
jgi:iron-sulfur cluster repair protein YtfE (RIC family)